MNANDNDAAPAGPTSDELKHALQAFKKRLKLTQRDQESSLGRGPLSGGKKSTIVAIMPPHQFPRAVWDALVAQGKLRPAGHGMYEIVKHAEH